MILKRSLFASFDFSPLGLFVLSPQSPIEIIIQAIFVHLLLIYLHYFTLWILVIFLGVDVALSN